MTTAEFNKVLDFAWNKILFLRNSGQKEYAHDEDNVFANFERVGASLDLDRKKVLMVYLLKHLDGINAYIKGHKSQREGVDGRIGDALVYLLLLLGMVVEEDGIKITETK
jgi:hypothetical protein